MRRPPDDPTAMAGRLYAEYGASLYRYAVMLLADTAAAEDAVHQVFAAVLNGGVVGIQQDAHYLRRAVRNECYSMLRRRVLDGERRNRLQSDLPAHAHHFLEARAATNAAPEERIALQDAMRALPAEQREVLHLHVYEGMTFQEIADASAESINTIASRYRYAIGKLKDVLG
jgi:RNA polymerase sigma-70 factor (ECF subfamily)